MDHFCEHHHPEDGDEESEPSVHDEGLMGGTWKNKLLASSVKEEDGEILPSSITCPVEE